MIDGVLQWQVEARRLPSAVSQDVALGSCRNTFTNAGESDVDNRPASRTLASSINRKIRSCERSLQATDRMSANRRRHQRSSQHSREQRWKLFPKNEFCKSAITVLTTEARDSHGQRTILRWFS